MSCFMVRNESISALAGWMESLLNGGFNTHYMEAPEMLYIELRGDCADRYGFFSAEKIFSRLYDLNARAYIGRYAKNHPEVLEECYPFAPVEYEENRKHRRGEWGEGHAVVSPWHYEMQKRLDCFIYQCTEDANNGNELLSALVDLSRTLAGFIVRNNDAYCAAEWG